VYWYDAVQGPRLSLEQTTVAKLTGVKLRLGSLNSQGEQKGVDSLIVTDLIELARNRAISDAVVISGDEDLRVAVQVAQTFGVRIHILAVGDAANNVSNSLQMEADSVDMLDVAWIKANLTFRTDPPPQPALQPSAKQAQTPTPETGPTKSSISVKSSAGSPIDLEQVALTVCKDILSNVAPKDIEALRAYFESSKTIPPEFDRKLIAKTGIDFGRFLTSEEKRKVRGVLVGYVRKVAGSAAQ